jgi:hypothetical protein
MKKSIPPDLHAYVLQLFGQGKTSEDIAAALWREHKIETSATSVKRVLERYRTERADVAKGVIRERLRRELAVDLDKLEALHRRARAKESAATRAAQTLRKHEQDPGALKAALKYDLLALRAMDRQLRAINLVMHYAGADEPDAPVAQNMKLDRATLHERVRRLIESESNPEPAAVTETIQ